MSKIDLKTILVSNNC